MTCTKPNSQYAPFFPVLAFFLSVILSGCATVPDVRSIIEQSGGTAKTRMVGPRGPLTQQQSKELLKKLNAGSTDTLLDTHLIIEEGVAETPLIAGNRVHLLRDGGETYQAMFDAVRNARKVINMEFYIFEDIDFHGQKLSDLLFAKRREGVAINVIFDAVGSITTPREYLQSLKDGGINLVEYNPIVPGRLSNINDRDHRKMLIVDGSYAIVGGINISHSYSQGSFKLSVPSRPNAREARWRDTDLVVEGPAVAELQKLFEQQWRGQHGPEISTADFYPRIEAKSNAVVRIIGSSPSKEMPRYYVTLLSAIRNASKNILLSSGYFIPTLEAKKDLIDAVKRGVDVRLFLSGISDSKLTLYAQRSHYTDLLEAGVKIYETDREVMHAKTVTIDGVWSVVGSSNFDYRSALYNDEVDVVVIGRDTAHEVEVMFYDDIMSARQLDYIIWKKRPMLHKIKEQLSRMWQKML